MRTHAGTFPQLPPVKARTNYDSVRTGDMEGSGSCSSPGVAGNQWARRFCFVNNRWFEHPPLPRASGGRHQTTCRPIGPPLQARRDVVDRWEQFRLDPFPVFTYEVEGIEMEKSVFMIHGENSAVIHYEVRKNNRAEVPKNLRLEIRPLIAFRDYHGTTHENGVFNPAVQDRSGLASVTPYDGLPSLHLAHNAIELRKTGDWYRNFEYDAERERGLDFSEDLFNPFGLCFDLRLRRQASIIASTEQRDVSEAVEYRRAEITRRRKALVASPIEDGFAQSLAAASDQYLVSRGDEKTVIDGYHWFGDWA